MSIAHLMEHLIAKLVVTWYSVSWLIADKRVAVVIVALILGIIIANWLGKRSGSKGGKIIRLLRSVIGLLAGLSASSALVTMSIVTHAADLRWLPPGQRQAPSIPAPKLPAAPNVPFVGDALKIITNAVNSALQALATGTNAALHPLLSLTTPARAIMVAAGLVVQYGLLSALSGAVVVVLLVLAYFRERRNNRRRLDAAETTANDAQTRVAELERWISVLTGGRAYPDSIPPQATSG